MFWQMMPLPSLIGIVRETTYVTCIKKKKTDKDFRYQHTNLVV